MSTAVGHAALKADARNRATRVFLVGLAIDLAVAVALLVQEAASSADVDYRVLGASLIRTVVQTSAAYVLRRFLDPSRLPTPLPPVTPGPPADLDGALERREAVVLPPLPPQEAVDPDAVVEVMDEVPLPPRKRAAPRRAPRR